MNIKTRLSALTMIAACILTLASCSSSEDLVQNQGSAPEEQTPQGPTAGMMNEPAKQVTIVLSPGTIPVSEWESLGGCSTNTPSGVWTDESNFMVAAKGCDGQLWTKRWNNDVWMNWTSWNTCLRSIPNLNINPQTKQLIASYVDCSGRITLKSSRDAGATWQDMASRYTFDGSNAVATAWKTPSELMVFYVTGSGQVNSLNANALAYGFPNRVYNTTTTVTYSRFLFWSVPKYTTVTTNACALGTVSATSDLKGRIDVVYPSCNNTPSVATLNGNAWSFYNAPIAGAKHVDAVWNTAFPATLELFFQGTNNQLYQTSFANGQWTAPSPDTDPTPITTGIATTNLNVAGEITMLRNGSDNQVYMKFLIHTNPSSGGIQ